MNIFKKLKKNLKDSGSSLEELFFNTTEGQSAGMEEQLKKR